ncbi:MAG: hypothetical protein IPP03_00170 [Dechloromonas sp.]|jgi:aromatic ring-opening dioxygenase catalytic subunit (LigB family)|nr:hypothetical protein [Candidatus Dechloromonas phosphoritropha]MBP8785989.1 hypothetical protein [Azonexus sp.]MBP9226922.1 hypothetical protein [Azonexus sp.]
MTPTRSLRPALPDCRRQAPGALPSHPNDEHFLSLSVALGAGGENACGERFRSSIDDYVIAMATHSFLPQQRGRP